MPYEIHIYPKEHVQDLKDLKDKFPELGLLIKDTVTRFASIFEENAYVMSFHSSPAKGHHEYWHFHIEFYPPWRDRSRLKYLAGLETGGWQYTNDSSPEEKAKELREAI